MRELPISELSCVAGGIVLDHNAISVAGMVNSLAGYDFMKNVMQTLNLSEGKTQIGTCLAAFGGGNIALSLWNEPEYVIRNDRLYVGMILGFLWGVFLSVVEEAQLRNSSEHH